MQFLKTSRREKSKGESAFAPNEGKRRCIHLASRDARVRGQQTRGKQGKRNGWHATAACVGEGQQASAAAGEQASDPASCLVDN